MKIVVCIKQVPDNDQVKIDAVTGTLVRQGEDGVINPDDKHALEAALELGEQLENAEVIVVSMGPAQAEYALRECLAMGADRAILLNDKKFAGSDSWATANVLSFAIKKIVGADLVITGTKSTDGETAQVGPELAEKLGLSQIMKVCKLTYKDGGFLAELSGDQERITVRAKMPLLITVSQELNQPRYLPIAGILNAYQKEIIHWNQNDLGIPDELIGLAFSPTQVERSFVVEHEKSCIIWQDSPEDMVKNLMDCLQKKKMLPI